MCAGLQRAAGGGAMESFLAAGAEVEEAAGAGAGGTLSLRKVFSRRAAALTATQRLVLLQTTGGLVGEREKKN